jgi:transposase
MSQPNNFRRCHTTLDQDSSLIAVVDMSQSSWLVAGIVPGIMRQPPKKLKQDQIALLGLLRRWQDEAAVAGAGFYVLPPMGLGYRSGLFRGHRSKHAKNV